jgi:hypothetical protein
MVWFGVNVKVKTPVTLADAGASVQKNSRKSWLGYIFFSPRNQCSQAGSWVYWGCLMLGTFQFTRTCVMAQRQLRRRRMVPQRFAEENYDHNQQLVLDLQPQAVHEAAVTRGVAWHELIADPRLRNPQFAFQVLTDSEYVRFVREWHVEPCWVFGGRVLNRPPFTLTSLNAF